MDSARSRTRERLDNRIGRHFLSELLRFSVVPSCVPAFLIPLPLPSLITATTTRCPPFDTLGGFCVVGTHSSPLHPLRPLREAQKNRQRRRVALPAPWNAKRFRRARKSRRAFSSPKERFSLFFTAPATGTSIRAAKRPLSRSPADTAPARHRQPNLRMA